MRLQTRFRGTIATVAVVSSIVALLALVGCSSNKVTNPPSATGSTTFKGTISGTSSGGGVSGTLKLTANTATPAPQNVGYGARAVVTMTGTLVLNGSSTAIALSGNYDDVAKTFNNLAGGGWTFMGASNGFGLEGSFTGPGSATGVFTVQTEGSGADTVFVMIGSFTSTATPTPGPGGVFNIGIRGAVVHGNAFEHGGSAPIPLDGTFIVGATGTHTINIVDPGNPTGPPAATGTYVDATGAVNNGTYTTSSDTGTWVGQKQ